jgi:hypothetical protein
MGWKRWRDSRGGSAASRSALSSCAGGWGEGWRVLRVCVCVVLVVSCVCVAVVVWCVCGGAGAIEWGLVHGVCCSYEDVLEMRR